MSGAAQERRERSRLRPPKTGTVEALSGRTPFSRSSHLVALIAEAERLSALLSRLLPPSPTPSDPSAVKVRGTASPAMASGAARTGQDEQVARIAEELLAEAAVASLRLDGSPIDHAPDLESLLEVSTRAPQRPIEHHAGSWLEIFHRGQVPDEEVLAVEYLGMRAGLAATDLAHELHVAPQQALAELHRRLTRQLLDPAHAGHLRRSRQAVHDVRIGRMLFVPTDPERIPSRMAYLGEWLISSAAREHGLVVSGVIHHELLAAHPYEAANGRLARTAARLLLRRRGLDPGGLAAAELALLADPIGYYGEMAATARRGDLTIWLERWGEAVTAGLRLAARRLDLLDVEVPEPVETFLARWEKPRFTVADYQTEMTVGLEETRADLERLLEAGRIERVLASRGLRFAIVGYEPPD